MIETNPDSLERLKRFLSDSLYHDAIKNSSKYNSRICLERKQRLPFLDAHTGVAESDCSLWMPKWQRMPGVTEGQLYTYPAKRWRKKRRQYLLNDNFYSSYAKESAPSEQDLHAISVMENSALHPAEGDLENGEKALPPDDSKDSWYKDYEETMEIPDIPDPEEQESEVDDYEETYMKKKKKKSKTPRFKKRDLPNDEKPYVCDLCSARYKTRPGLSYHYAHSHNNNNNNSNNNNNNNINNNTNNGTSDNDDFSNTSSSKSIAASSAAPPSSSLTSSSNAQLPSSGSGAHDDALAGLKKFQDSFLTFLKSPSASGNNGQKTPGGQSSSAPPSAAVSVNSLSPLAPSTPSTPNPTANGKSAAANAYCDFCLGDNNENKKTQQPEELVTCSDCGRSAHPTCLQFTPTMTASVKKYKWQCIECKSCGLCGTSDNDDQLLFCDDCDRGYHMYCLTPPLSEPPEGSWSCHLCVAEYHGGIPK